MAAVGGMDADVEPNPPDLRQRLAGRTIVPVVMSFEEDRRWLKTYQETVRSR